MHGRVRIWYYKQDCSRDMGMGSKFLKRKNLLPDIDDLSKTHCCISDSFMVNINLDRLFHDYQGFNWSPNGEARDFILSKGLDHTSMSVGDIIQVGDKLYMVDRFGFFELN